MLKVMFKVNKIFTVINKYFYILPLISMVTSLNDNKIFRIIREIIKIIIVVNIVLGVGLIIYFTDIVSPINTTLSIYNDLLEPYIELIKTIWDKIINYFTPTFKGIESPTSSIKNEVESILKDATSQIKEGVKEGVKEALDEALSQMHEDEANSDLLKQLALFSSTIFFIYFIFILPGGSPITPEDLAQYNWMNQSLIEIKITVKDFIISLFSNPSNPSNPGGSPSTPGNNGVINLPSPISQSSSGSTVTPSLFKDKSEVGIQTILNGTTVGKMVETTSILADVLGPEDSNMIQDKVNELIKNITD